MPLPVAVLDFVALPREAVESSIRANLTEADIEDRYALEKAQLASPEKRSVTQLLFNEEAQAKDAAEALKAGQSLGEVKARFKPQVTEMKDIGKNALPAEAAASVFALKEGEISVELAIHTM